MSGRRAALAALVFALASTALGGMPVWMLSAYAPRMQQDVGFDAVAQGIALGSFFAVSALTGIPLGRFVERVGWRWGIAFTAGLSALSLVGIALFAHSFGPLIALLCLGALANSSSQPAGNEAIAERIDRARHGLAFGVKQAALPISTFVVGLSVPLFDDGARWREAFATMSVIAAAVVVSVTARRLASLVRMRPSRRPRTRRADGPPAPTARPRVPASLILLAIGAGCGTAVTMSLGGFTVLYATSLGWSPAAAGQLLAGASVAGIVSRVLSGHLADRRRGRHLIVVSAMMAGGGAGMFVLALWGGTIVGLLVGVIAAFGLGWAWNGVFHLATVRYSPTSPAVTTSVAQTAMSVGATIGPPAFGVVSTVSFPLAWAVSGVAMLVAAAFVLIGRRALSR